MVDFITQERPEFIDAEGAAAVPRGVLSEQQEYQDLVIYNGNTPQEAEAIVQGLVPPTYGVSASQSVLDRKLEEGASLQEIEEAIAYNEAVSDALKYVDQFSAVDSALAEDPVVAFEVFSTQSKLSRGQNRLLDLLESWGDDSTAAAVLEFIDAAAYMTLEDFYYAPRALRGEGGAATAISEEWLEAARTLDDDAFDQWVEDRIDSLTTSMLHGTESHTIIFREIEALMGAGFVLHDKELSALFSGVALAELSPFALKGLGALARGTRSTIGRLRGAAGTVAATEVAEAATEITIRRGVNGEILDPIIEIEDLRVAVEGETAPPPPFQRPLGSRIRDDVEEATILDETAPTSHASNMGPTTSPPVSQGVMSNVVAGNSLIRAFIRREGKFAFGASDTFDNIEGWVAEQKANLRAAVARPVIDTNVVNEGMQSYRMSATIGKSDGTPFTTFQGAKRLAEKVEGGRIVNLRDGKYVDEPVEGGQYAVGIEYRMNVGEKVDALDLGQVGLKGAIGKMFASSGFKSPSYYSNLIDAAEQGAQGFKREIQKRINQLNKLSKEDARFLNEILASLRDDVSENGRVWLPADEVARRYEAATGNPITRKVLKAYETLVEMSDFAWFVEASRRLHVVTQADGFVAEFANGISEIVYRYNKSIAPETKVFHVGLNRVVRRSELGDAEPIYIAASQLSNGVQFVSGTTNKLRLPKLNDVLGYNPGGFRTNPDAKWFVGGTGKKKYWRTLLGARTEKEAIQAQTEFNTISAAVRGFLGSGKITDETLLTLSPAERAQLNDVIRANNNWNPEIESIEDFFEFTQRRGMTTNEEVLFKQRDAKVTENMYGGDRTLIDLGLHRYVEYTRQADTLTMFGGTRAINPDPIGAIATRFNRQVSQGAKIQYRLEHTTAWVKALRKAIDEKKLGGEVKGMHLPLNDEARVRNLEIIGDSQVARKLRQEQEIILRRLNALDGTYVDSMGNRVGDGTSRFADRVLESVFNRKVASNLDDLILQRFKFSGKTKAREVKEFVIDEGSRHMMSVGFAQKMMSPDQLFLQASHAWNIGHATAFTGQNGYRALFLGATLRKASWVADDNFWNVLNKRLARAVGIDDETYAALLDHLNTSGRGYMRGAVADDPAAADILRRSGLRKLGHALSTPYYAGENYAATVSRITAFLDVHKRNPDLAFDSTQFWNKVQERDRTLSFAMNSVQKSRAQTDAYGKVIGQWTSYQMRAVETVLYGRGLSAVERTALAGSLTVMYGAVGFGIYSTAAAILPDDMPESWRRLALKGPIDWLSDNTLGVSIGSRVAPLSGAFDRLIGTVADPLQTVPAIKLIDDTRKRAAAMFHHAVNYRSGSLLQHDALTLARVFKVVDGPVMAWTMLQEDARITATGTRIDAEFTPIQEALQALGLTPTQAVDLSLASGLVFNATQRRKDAVEKALPVFRLFIDKAADGDWDAANDLITTADAIIRAYGLPDSEFGTAWDEMVNQAGRDKVEYTILRLFEMGFETEAISLAERTK